MRWTCRAPTRCMPWVGVWCGAEAGQLGFDPTNDMIAGEDHVVVAIGRDYAEIAPIDGIVFASGGQKLDVAVTVTPVDVRNAAALLIT